MFEILFTVWLLLSILALYIFCAAARRFVSKPDQEPTSPDNVVVHKHKSGTPVRNRQPLPPAKMCACGD